jgi:predicted nucleic acid-binding Zn ribbon protein
MADQCDVSRCHDPNCRMPLPNRYYHTVLSGTTDQRFCSGRCLRNWRRNRTRAVSALQAALSIEASRDWGPEEAHL